MTTAVWLLAILLAAAVAWGSWERWKGAEARRLNVELGVAKERIVELTTELLAERNRIADLQTVAINVSEECRAAIPDLIANVPDTVLAARLAHDHLASVLDKTIGATRAASARATGDATPTVPGKVAARAAPASAGEGDSGR